MPPIRILPDILANKIAAGEVVERPASVVKELVENALDAQGSRIRIEIDKGGRSLIRVADNGTGMGHDDALLALERFATSKLHSDEDLGAIGTLGFRGEALPSIAAVSKMTLVTRDPSADSGVQVQINGGRIDQVTETGAPPGTMVSVARLFYNTPARRKFLKTVATEMGHVADTVAGLALGWPRVHFELLHNGKTIKQWPRANDPADRVADVVGLAAQKDLIVVQRDTGELSVRGYVGAARLARNTSRGTYLFVNGRRVRDRIVQHALFQGFRGRLMKGQFPLAVLFLTLPLDQVDVNVHPTKHEIRFARPNQVHTLVRDSVAEALTASERRLWGLTDDDHTGGVNSQPVVGEQRPAYAPSANRDWANRRFPGFMPRSRAFNRPTAASGVETAQSATSQPDQPSSEPATGTLPTDQQTLWRSRQFADLKVIGQFRGTYILCQDETDLIVIDQHAAHERIVYEHMRQKAGPVESQRLLTPETVELGFAEARLLTRLIDGLNGLGLEIEPFGGTTFVVKAVPAMLDLHDAAQMVKDLVGQAAGMGLDASRDAMDDAILDQCRKVMACHRSVRANQSLAGEQIHHLLAQLDECRNPSHCPHGRPTWIRWRLGELEKAFGRITP